MPLPLLALAAGAGVLGKLFGGASKGAATERAATNAFAQNTDQIANQQYGMAQSARSNLLGQQEAATMNRAQLGLQAPNVRAKQAILGSMLQQLQSARVTPPAGVTMGQLSGGIDPSRLLNPAARAGGADLQRQALMALLTKSDVPAPTDFVRHGTIAPPSASQYKGAGKLESILSALGLLGSAAGGLGEAAGAYTRTKGSGG